MGLLLVATVLYNSGNCCRVWYKTFARNPVSFWLLRMLQNIKLNEADPPLHACPTYVLLW